MAEAKDTDCPMEDKKATAELPWKAMVILLAGLLTGGGAGTFAVGGAGALKQDGSATAELTLVMKDTIAATLDEHAMAPHRDAVQRVEFNSLKRDNDAIKRMLRKLCRAQFPEDRECDDL
tara:strand:+ start:1092 stop:1451 length:360 start_codon:yes stop_codon:yes gene_type:complete